MTRDALLVVNAGSSSLKFQLYDAAGDPPVRLLKGHIDGIGVRPRPAQTVMQVHSLQVEPQFDQDQQQRRGQ